MVQNLQRRTTIVGVAMALVLSTAPSLWGQSQSQPAGAKAGSVARTPWGDPDLQGTYTNSNESGISMEKPAEFAGKRQQDVTQADLERLIKQRAERQQKTAQTIGGSAENDTGAGPPHWYENYNATNSRAWMISDPEDGKIPALTDEAKKRAAAVRAAHRGGDGYNTGPFDGPQDLTLYVRCITRGLPGSMMPAIYGNTYDISQGPGFVAIRYEMVHETRIIPLDNRERVSAPIRSDMGVPRGRWEGNTLVVETTNFKARSAYRNANADTLKLVERFTRTAADKIEWTVTVDDPTTWSRPWTFAIPLTMNDQEAIFEYACHEGNQAIKNILNAARAAER